MARISKVKKTRVVRRVYERGRETTISSASRHPLLTRAQNRAPHNKKIKPTSGISPKSSSPQRAVIVDNCELPSHYGTTNVTLMVKDPFWLYAYWEVAQDHLMAIKDRLSKEDADAAKMVLRIYDVSLVDFNGTNANRYFDIEVGCSTNWYINGWGDNVSYVAEIGLRIKEGNFISLARSNYVHTPRAGHSPRSEQIWMEVTDEAHSTPFIKPASSMDETSNVSRASSTPPKTCKIINISEEDIKNYYSHLSSPLREIVSARINKLYAGTSSKYSFVLEGDTEEERQRIFAKFFPRDYFARRLPLAGSSEELVVLEKEEGENVSGGASGFIQGKVKPRKFFFELDTELIVYGRTEPDAEVKIGEQKISLRPDGTFSLRFALPDGKLPLEFTAASADKTETRKINTYVERKTTKEDLK